MFVRSMWRTRNLTIWLRSIRECRRGMFARKMIIFARLSLIRSSTNVLPLSIAFIMIRVIKRLKQMILLAKLPKAIKNSLHKLIKI